MKLITYSYSYRADIMSILYMTEHGVIRSDQVFEAMLATDRGTYSNDYPYEDSPQSIGLFIVQQAH